MTHTYALYDCFLEYFLFFLHFSICRGHFIAPAFFWWQTIDGPLDLTNEAISRSSEDLFDRQIIHFNFAITRLVSKLPKLSLNGPKTTLTSEDDLEAFEVSFRKCLHDDFQENVWLSLCQLFINLIVCVWSSNNLNFKTLYILRWWSLC